jgi:hypothetical protein
MITTRNLPSRSGPSFRVRLNAFGAACAEPEPECLRGALSMQKQAEYCRICRNKQSIAEFTPVHLGCERTWRRYRPIRRRSTAALVYGRHRGASARIAIFRATTVGSMKIIPRARKSNCSGRGRSWAIYRLLIKSLMTCGKRSSTLILSALARSNHMNRHICAYAAIAVHVKALSLAYAAITPGWHAAAGYKQATCSVA